ncbi:MAG: orotidine-5'-phosphate decarboxylase [Deltaproteobacteria bacterium]|nr:orotidine-5'-phosphate decarboxylase [Deltaproteobacteria bacterium]
MNQNQNSNIIIALDAINYADALYLAKTLRNMVWGFKVNDLLIEHGIKVITDLRQFGRVFADPKLHDIPNTVKNSIQKIASAGADFITVHASGGMAMIKAAVEAACAEGGHTAKILAVTALTSLNDEDTNVIYGKDSSSTVTSLARIALDSKCFGIVCSAQELPLLADMQNLNKLAKIVPGIRPAWHTTSDDQNRTDTPLHALSKGADYLVIGRPITKNRDPIAAIRSIMNDEITYGSA